MVDFDTITPENVNKLSEEDLLTMVSENSATIPKKNRLAIIKMVYQILGFDLSNDVLLALLAENQAQLCLSTAGGGKTTFSQVKILLEKLWRKQKNGSGRKVEGYNVLCLVYNRHNKRDMEEKQKTFVRKVVRASPGVKLDENVKACTMHSFCKQWCDVFVMKTGMAGYHLAQETQVKMLFETAALTASKKLKEEATAENLIKLYNYQKETLLTDEELTDTIVFEDAKVSIDYIKLVFKVYDSLKKTKRLYDFNDMVLNFYELLKKDEKVLEEVQSFYEYIVADEVQDFTPVMWEILKLLVSDGTPLLCIGDEDQNLYSFRGASVWSTLNFKKEFADAEVFLLSTNRRCSSEILDVAKRVISKNHLRFDKPIDGNRIGGKVDLIPYNSEKGQFYHLIERVKKEGGNSTVIAYREKDTSVILCEQIARSGIPFYVVSGYRPFSHELYKHLADVFNMLEYPTYRECQLNLYKVLPISKTENQKILGYDPVRHKFNGDETFTHFQDLDYGRGLGVKGFSEALSFLSNLSEVIDKAPMSSYFEKVFNLFKRYFWNYKKKLNDNASDSSMESFLSSLCGEDKIHSEFVNDLQKQKAKFQLWEERREGLALSTFHGLKGLEFDKVYIVNMDEEIYPNFARIDSHNYSKEKSLEVKESERRLLYVAVTRARDELVVYYKSDNPSIFTRELMGMGELELSLPDVELESVESLFTSVAESEGAAFQNKSEGAAFQNKSEGAAFQNKSEGAAFQNKSEGAASTVRFGSSYVMRLFSN